MGYAFQDYIKEIICSFAGKDTKEVPYNNTTLEELGVDLIEELMIRIENECNIRFRADEDLRLAMTIDEVIQFIMRKKGFLKI